MVNTFSFCIFGEYNPLYYDGLIENLQLIAKHYPDWLTFVYVGSDVPNEYVQKIRSFPKSIVRYTGQLGLVNTMYRFFAIDEPGVELMFVRDADSRVHWKDRWAIKSFLKNNKKVHIIRDHYYHDAPMLAGMWGMRKIEGLNMRELFDNFMKNPTENIKGIDQDFLKLWFYPKINTNVLVHHSNDYILVGELAVKFPFEWSHDIYCGRVQEGPFQDSEQPNYRVSINFRR